MDTNSSIKVSDMKDDDNPCDSDTESHRPSLLGHNQEHEQKKEDCDMQLSPGAALVQDEVDILVKDPLWYGVFTPHKSETPQQFLQHLLEKIYRISKIQVLKAPNKATFFLSIVLCDDAFIKDLNKTHRGFDKATNCLSFPSGENLFEDSRGRPQMLGEIFLARETLVREAQVQEKPVLNHFIHLVLHSLLHLYGFDHEGVEEAEIMEALEVKILHEFFGIENPYKNTNTSN